MTFRCEKAGKVAYACVSAGLDFDDYRTKAEDLCAKALALGSGEAADFDTVELVPDLASGQAQEVESEG